MSSETTDQSHTIAIASMKVDPAFRKLAGSLRSEEAISDVQGVIEDFILALDGIDDVDLSDLRQDPILAEMTADPIPAPSNTAPVDTLAGGIDKGIQGQQGEATGNAARVDGVDEDVIFQSRIADLAEDEEDVLPPAVAQGEGWEAETTPPADLDVGRIAFERLDEEAILQNAIASGMALAPDRNAPDDAQAPDIAFEDIAWNDHIADVGDLYALDDHDWEEGMNEGGDDDQDTDPSMIPDLSASGAAAPELPAMSPASAQSPHPQDQGRIAAPAPQVTAPQMAGHDPHVAPHGQDDVAQMVTASGAMKEARSDAPASVIGDETSLPPADDLNEREASPAGTEQVYTRAEDPFAWLTGAAPAESGARPEADLSTQDMLRADTGNMDHASTGLHGETQGLAREHGYLDPADEVAAMGAGDEPADRETWRVEDRDMMADEDVMRAPAAPETEEGAGVDAPPPPGDDTRATESVAMRDLDEAEGAPPVARGRMQAPFLIAAAAVVGVISYTVWTTFSRPDVTPRSPQAEFVGGMDAGIAQGPAVSEVEPDGMPGQRAITESGSTQPDLDAIARGLQDSSEFSLSDLFLGVEPDEDLAAEIEAPVTEPGEPLVGLSDFETLMESVRILDENTQDLLSALTMQGNQIARLEAELAVSTERAERAESLALAQNQILVRFVAAEEKLEMAEQLIVDLSRRISTVEGADPADRSDTEARLAEVNEQLRGLQRDVGMVARIAINGSPTAAQGRVPSGQANFDQATTPALRAPVARVDAVPADVAVGDFVNGFGAVLEIFATSDGGRMVVMENGSVVLN